MSDAVQSNTSLDTILVNVLKVPGVRVNRKDFLSQSFAAYVEPEKLRSVIEKGPIEAGVNLALIDKIAESLVGKRTIQSTLASFLAGLPGGFAMAATIPADTLQFFGVSLRIAQEMAYLFGYKDLWEGNEIDMERVKGELTLFLGVMFGVSGSASALKVVSAKVSQQMLKKLPQAALTKTVYYPIIKKIAATVGIKVTKKTFAQGVSKVVPFVGGVVSGGLTYFTMKPMGNRLKKTLYESVHNYTAEDFEKDYAAVQKAVIDVEAEVIEIEDDLDEEENVAPVNKGFSVADELLKFKQLLDMGVLTQEEFDLKKAELLNIKLN
ncbi:bacteriochlorophyll 4-vinyl reductase [Paenibacillus mesophilus]|uniref:SHOCT domain-containing protein n=1 Tax=Paenibacillus mesophilus TaxID=2582849 RepID=UPI00110F005D|nr:SHOCT domain-containing protein [Paenibacillus mesophilus]TMV49526.1 bacteriochlorophyll 4-vinyl reductase [Paenibacillus mesophilus]